MEYVWVFKKMMVRKASNIADKWNAKELIMPFWDYLKTSLKMDPGALFEGSHNIVSKLNYSIIN